MGESGGLTGDDPDAGTAVAPRGQFLDPAVVEGGRRRAAVLHEHLGELATGAQCDLEGSSEQVRFEQGLVGHVSLLGRSARSAAYRRAGRS